MTTSLRTRDGLIARAQALALGLSPTQIQVCIEKGTWERVHRGVYRSATAPRTDRQHLRAACLAAGERAVASHQSAAWLWDLIEKPPPRPEITVPTPWSPALTGVRIHRSSDLDAGRTVLWTGIPTTDPLRTLVDLGAVMSARLLSDVLDRSLARRLCTTEGGVAEIVRLSRRGRAGTDRLRRVIAQRGMVGAPHPSVLESRMLRLIVEQNLPVPAVEVVAGPDGEYRLDFAYPLIKLAIEVDGYLWHFTPEQLKRDHMRRNRLQAEGWQMLVFTWTDVTQHPDEVAAAIRRALRRDGPGRHA